MKLGFILLIWMAVLSIIDFILYGIDKKKAKKGKWRIMERTLLLWGFLGGAIGGILGMKAFRHKTKHWYFWAVNIAGLLVQTATTVFLFIKDIKIVW